MTNLIYIVDVLAYMKVELTVSKVEKDVFKVTWKVGEREFDRVVGIGAIADILNSIVSDGEEAYVHYFWGDESLDYKGYVILNENEAKELRRRLNSAKSAKEIAEEIVRVVSVLYERIKEIDRRLEKDVYTAYIIL